MLWKIIFFSLNDDVICEVLIYRNRKNMGLNLVGEDVLGGEVGLIDGY